MADSRATIRLLLVDDDTELANGLARRLTRQGMLVDVASCGQDAMERMRRKVYEVAVIEVALPGMSGLDLLRVIKVEHPKMAVLLLLAQPDASVAREGRRAGAFDYLAKSVDGERMGQWIDAACRQACASQPVVRRPRREWRKPPGRLGGPPDASHGQHLLRSASDPQRSRR